MNFGLRTLVVLCQVLGMCCGVTVSLSGAGPGAAPSSGVAKVPSSSILQLCSGQTSIDRHEKASTTARSTRRSALSRPRAVRRGPRPDKALLDPERGDLLRVHPNDEPLDLGRLVRVRFGVAEV